MQRIILPIAIALTIITFSAHAQQPDTALFYVHYKFTYVRDTTNRAHPYTENMVLCVGKTASNYRSYDRAVSDEQFKKQIDDQLKNSPDGNITTNRRMAGSLTEIYQYPNQKTMLRKEFSFNNYLMADTLHNIAWRITNDTATFGDLHCQKATAHFKGRDYTAWFCPDLPLHVGPWKLNGLPGAIVDAYDTKKEVVFKFDGVEKASPIIKNNSAADNHEGVYKLFGDLTEDLNIIKPPAKSIQTTTKEFAKLQAAMEKDPQAFANSAIAADGPSPKMAMSVKRKGPEDVINNPIELPEKGSK